MLVLALDSSATASVALARIDSDAPGASAEILASYESEDTRSHAEVMAPYAAQVLADTGLDGAAVDAVLTGTGPGPFTGLRAGIMTARTLGFAWNKPVYGLMSLTAIVERAFADGTFRDSRTAANSGMNRAAVETLVASDARRREIYCALFAVTENGYSLAAGPSVGPAHQTHAPAYDPSDPAAPALGYGAGLYTEALTASGWNVPKDYAHLHPTAADLVKAAARCGVKNLSRDTQALYLRESDAKVPAAMLARTASAQPPHGQQNTGEPQKTHGQQPAPAAPAREQ